MYPFNAPSEDMGIEDFISGQGPTLWQQLQAVDHCQPSVHLSSLHVDLHELQKE